MNKTVDVTLYFCRQALMGTPYVESNTELCCSTILNKLAYLGMCISIENALKEHQRVLLKLSIFAIMTQKKYIQEGGILTDYQY